MKHVNSDGLRNAKHAQTCMVCRNVLQVRKKKIITVYALNIKEKRKLDTCN